MIQVKNVHGRYYPPFHCGWGGFAEELFHYTSRYYHATECFLRHLAQQPDFCMSGYKAARLSPPQRDLMAAALSCAPGRDSARAACSLVGAVCRGDRAAPPCWTGRFGDRLRQQPKPDALEGHTHPARPGPDVSPFDPFLCLAERLQLPVAISAGSRHVDVCLHALAGHLDSPNITLRTNLLNAILQLHNGGFVLHNHPHLTHAEARRIRRY